MNRTKHKYILRAAHNDQDIKSFEDDVNKLMQAGWEPHGIEVIKNEGTNYLCMAMMGRPPEKCDCDCPCCIEIHHGSCDCDCDCCLAHAHRDGRYHKDDDD